LRARALAGGTSGAGGACNVTAAAVCLVQQDVDALAVAITLAGDWLIAAVHAQAALGGRIADGIAEAGCAALEAVVFGVAGDACVVPGVALFAEQLGRVGAFALTIDTLIAARTCDAALAAVVLVVFQIHAVVDAFAVRLAGG
jgi:hypothetical protein